jgi:hypothetical protein
MKKILTLFLITIICSGCSSVGLQVNERAFIQLFGLEKKGAVYYVYMQLLENETISGEGETIMSAVADAELSQGKKLFLGQMKLFVIGSGLTDFESDLNLFLSGDICPACPVLYSENPEDIITSESAADDILKELSVYSSQGKSIITPLTEIAAKSVGNRTAAVIPNVIFKEDIIKFDGLILLDESGKAGTLSNEDALGIKILCDKFEHKDRVTVSALVGAEMISGEILGMNIKRKVYEKDDILILRVEIKIKSDITEKPIEMPDIYAVEAITDYVRANVLTVFDLTIKSFNVDAIGLEKLVRQQLPERYEAYKENPALFWENSVLEIVTATE